MNRLAPRFQVHPDGTATLSGVNYRDLRSILTAAGLNHYDTEKEIEEKRRSVIPKQIAHYANDPLMQKVVEANQRDNETWAKRLRNTLILIDQAFEERNGFKASWKGKKVTDLTPFEKRQRLEDVKDKKNLRLHVARIVEDVMATRRLAKEATNDAG